MKILIYDDNPYDLSMMQKILKKFFSIKNIDYDIYICKNTEFLFSIIDKVDLIFLDIELNNENGIDIGLEIRKHNSLVRIIITSSYSKYLIDGYKVQADRYFIKPIDQNIFNIEFEDIVKRYLRDYEGIYDAKIYKNKILYKDILYIEYIDRKAHIHLLNSKVIDTPYSLKHWEENLNERIFAKPHKSFLVNLQYLSGFSKNDIILINNEVIPLSRHFKNDFNLSYTDYLQGGI